MSYSVYEIKTPDGMIYIGRTTSPQLRHIRSGYESQPTIYNSFDNCEITILICDLNEALADMLEHLLIRYYKSIEVSLNDRESRIAREVLESSDGYKSNKPEEAVSYIVADINEDLKHRFKISCAINNETQKKAYNRMVRHYVDTNGNLTEKK